MAYRAGSHEDPFAQNFQHGSFLPHYGLDPTQPAFQPTGTELQRTQPRSGADPSFHDMQRWMGQAQHVNNSKMNSLELRLRRLEEKHEQTVEMVGNDLRYLESQMKGKEKSKEIEPHAQTECLSAQCETDRVVDLVKHKASTLSPEKATTMYTDEAAAHEAVAVELRQLAEQITCPAPKLLEAPGVADHEQMLLDDSPQQQLAIDHAWTPVTIRDMPKFSGEVPADHNEIFSFDLLQDLFRGKDHCDGFYFMRDPLDLQQRAYWLLEDDHQPFLPKDPGNHGAKLTPLLNDAVAPSADLAVLPEHYNNVPVFVRVKGTNQYRYYGHYSQTRFSDKVDYDTIRDRIPESTLRHWASRLAENGRPTWITEMLIGHFWPRPEYDGPIPTDSAISTPNTHASTSAASAEPLERNVKEALNKYAFELKDWQKNSILQVELLTENQIYDAFHFADTDALRGLRPYWEYLECTAYRQDYYRFLCAMKENPRLAIQPSQTAKPKPKIKIMTKQDRVAAKAADEERLRQAALDSQKPTTFVDMSAQWKAEERKSKENLDRIEREQRAKEAAERKVREDAARDIAAKRNEQIKTAVPPHLRKKPGSEDVAQPPKVLPPHMRKKSETIHAADTGGDDKVKSKERDASEKTSEQTDGWSENGVAEQNNGWGSTTEEANRSDSVWGDADAKPVAEKKNTWEGFGDMEAAKAANDAFKRTGSAKRRSGAQHLRSGW